MDVLLVAPAFFWPQGWAENRRRDAGATKPDVSFHFTYLLPAADCCKVASRAATIVLT